MVVLQISTMGMLSRDAINVAMALVEWDLIPVGSCMLCVVCLITQADAIGYPVGKALFGYSSTFRSFCC